MADRTPRGRLVYAWDLLVGAQNALEQITMDSEHPHPAEPDDFFPAQVALSDIERALESLMTATSLPPAS